MLPRGLLAAAFLLSMAGPVSASAPQHLSLPAGGGTASGEVASFPAEITDVAAGPDGALYVATATGISRIGSGVTTSAGPSPTQAGSDAGGRFSTLRVFWLVALVGGAVALRLRLSRRVRSSGA